VSDESRCGSRDADGSAAVRHQRFALLPGHTSSLDRTRSYQSDVSIAKLPSPFTFPLPMGERKPRQRWGKVFLQVCYQIGISFVGQVLNLPYTKHSNAVYQKSLHVRGVAPWLFGSPTARSAAGTATCSNGRWSPAGCRPGWYST
jgi:hypothetical protein